MTKKTFYSKILEDRVGGKQGLEKGRGGEGDAISPGRGTAATGWGGEARQPDQNRTPPLPPRSVAVVERWWSWAGVRKDSGWTPLSVSLAHTPDALRRSLSADAVIALQIGKVKAYSAFHLLSVTEAKHQTHNPPCKRRILAHNSPKYLEWNLA